MATYSTHLSARIVDEAGYTRATDFYSQVADSNTLATVVNDCAQLLDYLDPLTDGVISLATLRIQVPLTGTALFATTLKTTAPSTGAQVTRVGLFGMSSTGTDKHWSGAVPALSRAATVVVNEKIINTSGSAPRVFADYLVTGGTALKWSDNNYQPFISPSYTLIATRKDRKATQRGTRNTMA